MRILFLGDVVGEPGRKMIRRAVPALREAWSLDLVVANAENAAGGSGLDSKSYRQLAAAGVDACTMGDHVFRRHEITSLFQQAEPICRPANYPSEAPGPDHLLITARDGTQVAVINLVGRLFMKPVDCPFHAVDRVLASLPPSIRVILVDMHAEATSEKQLMLRHCLGRVSAVVGTHTHVPTADARVFPPGTAFVTDLGMTGPYESIIGRKIEPVLTHARTAIPKYFEVATGDPRISGAMIEVDAATGAAQSIELVHLDREQIDALAPQAATQA